MLLNSNCYNIKVAGAVITASTFLSFGCLVKCISFKTSHKSLPEPLDVTSVATGGLEAHNVSCYYGLLSEFKLSLYNSSDFPSKKYYRYQYLCVPPSARSTRFCTTNHTKTFSNQIDLSKLAHLHVSCREESSLSQFQLQKQSKNSNVDVYYSFTCCKYAPAQVSTQCRRVKSFAVDNSHSKPGPTSTLAFLSDMAVSCNWEEVLNNFTIVQVGGMFKYSFGCCKMLARESPPNYVGGIIAMAIFLLLGFSIPLTYELCKRAKVQNKENSPPLIPLSTIGANNSAAPEPLLYEQRQYANWEQRNGASHSAAPELLTNEQLRNMKLSAVTKINESQLKIVGDLGSGAFGIVEKGELTPRASWQVPDNSIIMVAVKKPLSQSNRRGELPVDEAIEEKLREKEAKERELLEDEAKLLAHIGDHENVVRCYGVISENAIFNMVLEYCEGGDLKRYLNRLREEILDGADENTIMRKLVDLAAQVANGMAFIHSKRCVHRDLAARNILLTENHSTVKITDFGLAKDIHKNGIYKGDPSRKRMVPWAWTAPEFLRNLEYGYESDVWSFGVLFWEMMELGREPYINVNYTADFSDRLERGLRLKRPDRVDDDLHKVMLDCWEILRKNRPSFTELRQRLTDYLNTDYY